MKSDKLMIYLVYKWFNRNAKKTDTLNRICEINTLPFRVRRSYSARKALTGKSPSISVYYLQCYTTDDMLQVAFSNDTNKKNKLF